MTMGCGSYIPQLEVLVNSLLNLGIPRDDIGLVCIDKACTQHFHRQNIDAIEYIHQIDNTSCSANPKVSNVKCRVSMGKAESIMHHLLLGDALFFFDADVFLFQHPYESMSVEEDHLDLYVQYDSSQHNYYNFGAFLVYPSPWTIGLFEYIYQEFLMTGIWDQKLFNTYLNHVLPTKANSPLCNNTTCRFEGLNEDKFINMMVKPHVSHDNDGPLPNITLAHATCVEGEGTKSFAIASQYGSPIASYYTQQKTVSLDFPIDTDNINAETLDIVMRGLFYVASKTGRAIRMPMKEKEWLDDPRQPFAIVSTDYIQELGGKVVEAQYWTRAMHRHGKEKPLVLNNATFSVESFDSLISNPSLEKFDEISFSIQDVDLLDGNFLSHTGVKWSRSFLCGKYPRGPTRGLSYCLSVCDGGSVISH